MAVRDALSPSHCVMDCAAKEVDAGERIADRVRMSRLFVFLVAFGACMWLGNAPRVDARCAVQGLVPRVLTPTSARIPRDGGALVVGLVSGQENQEMPTGLELLRGRRTQGLAAQTLAPGLVRFAAVSRLLPGSWTVPALGRDAAWAIGREPMPGVPTRPSVIELRRLEATGMSARRTPRTEVRATLEFPVPEGIVAVVTHWGEAGAPAAWMPAIVGQREIVIWQEAARCQVEAPGTVPPPEGEGAVGRIAFVDRFGQMSPPSAAAPLR
jgi:hypothetical protein